MPKSKPMTVTLPTVSEATEKRLRAAGFMLVISWVIAKGADSDSTRYTTKDALEFAAQCRMVQQRKSTSERCPSVDTARDGGPVRCGLDRSHVGEHEADYSGPEHAARALVHRWPNEMALEACGCDDGLCMRHGVSS